MQGDPGEPVPTDRVGLDGVVVDRAPRYRTGQDDARTGSGGIVAVAIAPVPDDLVVEDARGRVVGQDDATPTGVVVGVVAGDHVVRRRCAEVVRQIDAPTHVVLGGVGQHRRPRAAVQVGFRAFK
jgi:hypothetical protein